ncbi:WxL domain-containing protein [Agrilactobacillus fermenti]|uniref:WxL domain-containing protein n=1 Tax=Agrilactobacillus fermenti TaxID=2586909 RepID=UPI001E3154FF|nr:WxL domain-containing protein [Agrilactobacillus fermenti]MCD2256945.1 WxL domain-containing protein [Agrilactobacillus fermenti]
MKRTAYTFAAILLATASLGSATTAFAAGNPDQALSNVATKGQENGAELAPNGTVTDTKNGSGSSYIGIGFKPGNLTLNMVPNFDFGGNNDFMKSTSFDLHAAGIDFGAGKSDSTGAHSPRAAIVTDARGNTDDRTGWNLKAKFEGLLTDDSNKALGKASSDGNAAPILVLHTKKAIVQAGTFDDNGGAFGDLLNPGAAQTDPAKPLYTGSAPNLVGDGNNDVSIYSNKNTDGDYVPVWSADKTQGLRSWGMNFKDKDTATLKIPTSQQDIGVFHAKLNWSLGNGPQ